MTEVIIISNGHSNQLRKRKWKGEIEFNADLIDADGDRIVSVDVSDTLLTEFAFLKSRPRKDHNPLLPQEV